jgi:hypothetical protein
MRAMEPLRSWMRSGLGSLSRIRVWSVEGPRGAKLGEVGEVEVVGDDGRDCPLPSPMRPSASTAWSAPFTALYLREIRPAANRLVSRSPCRRYRIVCGRGCAGRLGGACLLLIADCCCDACLSLVAVWECRCGPGTSIANNKV